jgi:PQQ-like domain
VKKFLLFSVTCLLTCALAQTNTQPLWQIEFDELPDAANHVFYGDSVIYYLQDNQLHVLDIQKGKQLWQTDYPLVTVRNYTILPATGEGLIFLPLANSLEALNERTGEVVWSYTLDEPVAERIEGTNNRTGIFYDKGYVFLQTKAYLTSLSPLSGRILWQQRKEGRFILDVQVLNDSYFVMTTEAILDMTVGHRWTEIRNQQGIYRLKDGQLAFSVGTDWIDNTTEIVNVTQEFVDTKITYKTRREVYLNRYEIETNEQIATCPLSFAPQQDRLRERLTNIIAYALTEISVVEDDWFYSRSVDNIQRTPFCIQDDVFASPPPESVSNEMDRYLLPTFLYYDTNPFVVYAGPEKGYFILGKDTQLYKSPVPKESFTYLYHNKNDDSSYIAPKFTDIKPVPYELITDVGGRPFKVELIGNLIVTLLEDSTLKVINFDTSEILLEAATNINALSTNTTFTKVANVLVIESEYLYQAFQFPSTQ